MALSRDEASALMGAAGDYSEGPEVDPSNDTWHYDHLKN